MARCALQVGSPSAACDSCLRASDRGSVKSLARPSALGRSINGTAVHRVCRVESRTVTPAAWPHHRRTRTREVTQRAHLSSPGRANPSRAFRGRGRERMCARVFGGRVIGYRAFCKQYVQAPPGRPLAQRALLNTRVRPRLFSCQRPRTRSLSLAPGVTRSLAPGTSSGFSPALSSQSGHGCRSSAVLAHRLHIAYASPSKVCAKNIA
jgi:hypothetical protein